MRVFKTKLIRLQLTAEELDALTADFISYKRDGVLPDIFGRDALYDGNDSNLLIVFYVQIMPDDFVMQLHRF